MKEFLIYQAVTGIVGIFYCLFLAHVAEKNSPMAHISSYGFSFSIFLTITAIITRFAIGF